MSFFIYGLGGEWIPPLIGQAIMNSAVLEITSLAGHDIELRYNGLMKTGRKVQFVYDQDNNEFKKA